MDRKCYRIISFIFRLKFVDISKSTSLFPNMLKMLLKTFPVNLFSQPRLMMMIFILIEWWRGLYLPDLFSALSSGTLPRPRDAQISSMPSIASVILGIMVIMIAVMTSGILTNNMAMIINDALCLRFNDESNHLRPSFEQKLVLKNYAHMVWSQKCFSDDEQWTCQQPPPRGARLPPEPPLALLPPSPPCLPHRVFDIPAIHDMHRSFVWSIHHGLY